MLVGPDFARPDVSAQLPDDFTAPDGWKVAAPQDHESRGEWWKNFDTGRLDDLVQQARSRNQDLAAAVARVEQARAVTAVPARPATARRT